MEEVTDEAIGTMIDAFSGSPTPLSGLSSLEYFHGAAIRVPVGATAFPLRKKGYECLLLTPWRNRVDSERCVKYDPENVFRLNQNIRPAA